MTGGSGNGIYNQPLYHRLGRREPRADAAGQGPLDRRYGDATRGAAPRGLHYRRAYQAQPGKAAGLCIPPQRAQRRRPRRGPHVHLLPEGRGRRPHEQLDGAGRDEGKAARYLRRVHARPDDVRYPLLDGHDRLAVCQVRRGDHRLDLRCLLHGDHDARRHEGL